jgi:hypothetical protein
MTLNTQGTSRLPQVGERKKTAWLPRDIRLGWHPNTPPGTKLVGWDLTSDTRQMWEVVSPGEDGESQFLGFLAGQQPTAES